MDNTREVIDVESLRSLGVRPTFEGNMVHFALPEQLPFSAASVRQTLDIIGLFGFRKRTQAEFRPNTGMVLKVVLMPNTGDGAIEDMLDAQVPIRATPTERDRAGIDLVHADGDSRSPMVDCVMIDCAQVLTADQLRRYVHNLTPVAAKYCYLDDTARTSMWRVFLHPAGYFSLGTWSSDYQSVLLASQLAEVVQPKNGTRSVSDVELLMSSPEDTDADMPVHIHIKGSSAAEVRQLADHLYGHLPTDFYNARTLDLGTVIVLTYRGEARSIQHPQLLGQQMTKLLRPIFRAIGTEPADGCLLHMFYPNPTDFQPADIVQTSSTHVIPIVSAR